MEIGKKLRKVAFVAAFLATVANQISASNKPLPGDIAPRIKNAAVAAEAGTLDPNTVRHLAEDMRRAGLKTESKELGIMVNAWIQYMDSLDRYAELQKISVSDLLAQIEKGSGSQLRIAMDSFQSKMSDRFNASRAAVHDLLAAEKITAVSSSDRAVLSAMINRDIETMQLANRGAYKNFKNILHAHGILDIPVAWLNNFETLPFIQALNDKIKDMKLFAAFKFGIRATLSHFFG